MTNGIGIFYFCVAYAIAGFPMIVGGVLSLVSRKKGARNLET
ncbi:MAG: hypothetical protein DDT29_02006 [Dehalococcoidia bacterium]|nr:hypothetical protein [Bacillota bacterium]